MKNRKKKLRALKEIKNELFNRNGLLKPAGYSCNGKQMMKCEYFMGDNDELMFTISCLLKTCVLALEGDTSFSLSTLSNADPKSNIVVALEFIISLLPREQMVSMDRITEILSQIDKQEHS